MAKRTGQIKHLIFWLDRKKRQQLSHATSFINTCATVTAKNEFLFQQNGICCQSIDNDDLP